jgi:hypothetical protein
MAFAQTPDLDQQEIVQDGKLEWDWSFGGHDSSYCYPATFASKDRIITLIVDNIADLIKGAKWQTDIPRP